MPSGLGWIELTPSVPIDLRPVMSETSLSLLDRLRDAPAEEDWRLLVDIYTPLIRKWLGQFASLPAADADDVTQEVLAVLVQKVGGFLHSQRRGAFRHWLRAIAANCLKDHWRRKRRAPVTPEDTQDLAALEQLADPASALSRLWDEEHDRHILRSLLAEIRPDFAPTTWSAFEQLVLQNQSPQQVAANLGISVNSVFIAKSRILAKLRQIGGGLLEDF